MLFDFGEGIHNDSEKEVEEDHEDQELEGPEEEAGGKAFKPHEGVEVRHDADVSQQYSKARVDGQAERREFL